MNIFYLHPTIETCVEHHVDQHVVKMPIETAQMLSTALRERCGIDAPYKSVYVNHPCTRWVGQVPDNFAWALDFGFALCDEYSHRYGKTHGVKQVLDQISYMMPLPEDWPGISLSTILHGITERPKCVAPEFKHLDVVIAYRMQYLVKKTRLFKWTGRPVPEWIQDTSWTERIR